MDSEKKTGIKCFGLNIERMEFPSTKAGSGSGGGGCGRLRQVAEGGRLGAG